MELNTLRMELGTTTTKQGLKLFRGEVEDGVTMLAATEWTEHPTEAHHDGHALLDEVRSDLAYREARYEAAEMFATAS